MTYAQAELHPTRPAVVGEDATVTYGEFRQGTGYLATALRAAGATAADPVAVVLERGAAQIVAVFAALCAGFPYACVDTTQPVKRIEAQLNSCGARIVVTDRCDVDFGPRTVINADLMEWTGSANPAGEPAAVVRTDLAYVMFTSGSTGAPKMVQVTHGGLANYARALAGLLAPDRTDSEPLRYATVTSLATDLGNTAIFPALTHGDTVHVVPFDIATDPDDFADYVESRRIDVLKTTPSHFGVLFDEVGPGVVPRHALVLGGEALGWRLVDRVRSASDCRVLNHYGPTEATVGALTYEVGDAPADHRAAATVPIGWPVTGVRAHLVDAASAQIRGEAEGELLLSGAGIADGYRGAPELTRERFLPDPFGDGGGPAYRTGDIVRRLADGAIEFLGRRDDQVKLRGHRVETGEVEHALRTHPGVRSAAVLLQHTAPQAPRLVAYVVPAGSDLTPRRLREYLSALLPGHLVPAEHVLVPELPLTLSGKLDVSALQETGARYRTT